MIRFYFPQSFVIQDFIQQYAALKTNRAHRTLHQQVTNDLEQLVNPLATPLPEATQDGLLDRLYESCTNANNLP